MWLHVALQWCAGLAASQCSSQKALECCAVVPSVKGTSSTPQHYTQTHKTKLKTLGRTSRYVHSRRVRARAKKLRGYFDLICLCYSSWKRLRSRQRIISAWGELTGAGLPPSFISASSHSLFSHLLPDSVHDGPLRWPASSLNAGTSPPLSFLLFFFFDLLDERVIKALEEGPTPKKRKMIPHTKTCLVKEQDG